MPVVLSARRRGRLSDRVYQVRCAAEISSPRSTKRPRRPNLRPESLCDRLIRPPGLPMGGAEAGASSRCIRAAVL